MERTAIHMPRYLSFRESQDELGVCQEKLSDLRNARVACHSSSVLRWLHANGISVDIYRHTGGPDVDSE